DIDWRDFLVDKPTVKPIYEGTKTISGTSIYKNQNMNALLKSLQSDAPAGTVFYINLTLPDGTVIGNVLIHADGTYTINIPNYNLKAGDVIDLQVTAKYGDEVKSSDKVSVTVLPLPDSDADADADA
ncbi:Rib/alpha-like domain-containing protein, partial [Listeria seeligeri]